MTDLAPIDPSAAPVIAGRDRIGWTLVASVGVHAMIFLILLLPRLPVGEPTPPPAVNVDIVTPSELASLEPRSSAASSEPSSEASSSQASEAPSSQASEAPSSKASETSSVEASSAASSQAASSEAASQASSSAAPPPASQAAASAEAPKPFPPPPARRITIPVGAEDSSSQAATSMASGEDSSEAASAEASASGAPPGATASLLAAAGEGAGVASAAAAAEPLPPMDVVGGGKLHAARKFYLKDMLASPFLSQAKAALKQMSPERRLAQTCNIEATGQAGGAGYQADAIIANAFAPPQASGTTYSVSGGVFRSAGRWYRIAYQCSLNADMSKVSSFSFHIGADVTDEIAARLNKGQ